jgi:RNA polymerase sigma-70 factor (ECF subfamily)
MSPDLPLAETDPEVEALLQDAARDDKEVVGRLLEKHRERLRWMVELRLDPYLAARVAADDVVQETFFVAIRKLPAYLANRPLPFYPWLHRLARDQLHGLRRRHRRDAAQGPLPDHSTTRLADLIVDSATTPGHAAVRAEQARRVREALGRLPEKYRELLIMRHLEGLKFSEIAAILDITVGAATMREVYALARIRPLLEERTESRQ